MRAIGCALLISMFEVITFAAERGEASPPSEQPQTKPNIVLILADDLGYGDIGCYGGTTPTPNLDRLAAHGIRLTNFYSNGPECTPTRTALLTGRYQQRVGGLECALGNGNVGRYDDAIRLREQNELGLPVAEISLARRLKDAGYATACVGKWHLGYDPKFFPGPHGFEYWFGPLGGGADYFHHVEPEGLPVLYLNGRLIHREGYMTDLITAEATQFIARTDDRPFFLYVPYTAPHTPIQGPNDRRERPVPADDWNKGTDETYAAMIRRLDDGIGEILRALDARNLAANTLVVFASDNGGTRRARNEPFSGTKGTLFEGGIRVPCIIRWPGRIEPGASSDQIGITMDLANSLTRVAGVSPPDGTLDGIDLLERLRSGATPLPRTLFWRARRGDVTWRAVRDGSLKFVSKQTGDHREEYLFDLGNDVAEKQNLIDREGAQAKRLRSMLSKWEVDVRPRR